MVWSSALAADIDASESTLRLTVPIVPRRSSNYLVIEQEIIEVRGGGDVIYVHRGVLGSEPVPHLIGVAVSRYGVYGTDAPSGGGGTAAHPNLAAHQTLGLATVAALSDHVSAADPHVLYALDADLANHETAGHAHAHDYAATAHAHGTASHGHAQGDVTGLLADLAGKAAGSHNHDVAYSATGHAHDYAAPSHTHAIADSTNLQTTLDGKAASAHTHGTAAHGHADADLPSGIARDTEVAAAYSVLGHTHPGGSGPTFVTITGTVANNNAVANTIADVTGLSFPVTSGTRYWFRFVILYTSAATTTGSRWSINGPAVTTLAYRSDYSLTATSRTVNDGLTGYNVPAASNATSLAAGNVAVIEGIILPSANGTVIARFASEVANSAITVQPGAHVQYIAL